MEMPKKESPIVYDYWMDDKNEVVYAILEFKYKKTDDKHSNVYLISKENKNGK